MNLPRRELKAELYDLVAALWGEGIHETKLLAQATGRSQQRIRNVIADLKLKRLRPTWSECKQALPVSLRHRLNKFRERSRNRNTRPSSSHASS